MEPRTGDVLMFTGNGMNASLLKIAMSSRWSHVGIAVRMDDKMNITLDDTGELYILEIYKGKHKDVITGKTIRGFGMTDFKTSTRIYNKVAYRRIREEYRDDKLVDLILKFHQSNFSVNFPNDLFPFVNIWSQSSMIKTGCSIGKFKFCSQMAAEFYHTLTEHTYKDIFGSDCPPVTELIHPDHFTNQSTLFIGDEVVFYKVEEDLWKIIISPLFIFIFIIVIILFIICYFFELNESVIIK